MTRNYRHYAPRRRSNAGRSSNSRLDRGSGQTRHRCAVCGRTELDNPELEFRYCSKCEGNYEYCQDLVHA